MHASHHLSELSFFSVCFFLSMSLSLARSLALSLVHINDNGERKKTKSSSLDIVISRTIVIRCHDDERILLEISAGCSNHELPPSKVSQTRRSRYVRLDAFQSVARLTTLSLRASNETGREGRVDARVPQREFSSTLPSYVSLHTFPSILVRVYQRSMANRQFLFHFFD